MSLEMLWLLNSMLVVALPVANSLTSTRLPLPCHNPLLDELHNRCLSRQFLLSRVKSTLKVLRRRQQEDSCLVFQGMGWWQMHRPGLSNADLMSHKGETSPLITGSYLLPSLILYQKTGKYGILQKSNIVFPAVWHHDYPQHLLWIAAKKIHNLPQPVRKDLTNYVTGKYPSHWSNSCQHHSESEDGGRYIRGGITKFSTNSNGKELHSEVLKWKYDLG
jgi:hypothetical protein